MGRQFYSKSEPFEFSPDITIEQELFDFEPEDFGLKWDSEDLEESIVAITLEQVRAILAADEPDYAAAARIGPQIIPHLKRLIASGDKAYASKAAWLASHIDDDTAVEALREAANSSSSLVRLAVAGGARRMTRPAASAVLMGLLSDPDVGVRKLAIKSCATRNNSALLAKIGELSRNDPAPAVRTLATKVVDVTRRKRSTGLT
jgi:HEAT repeat protein